jgi:hypothetical protein
LAILNSQGSIQHPTQKRRGLGKLNGHRDTFAAADESHFLSHHLPPLKFFDAKTQRAQRNSEQETNSPVELLIQVFFASLRLCVKILCFGALRASR